MAGCIFCKIAAGEIKSDIVHQDEQVVAFRDINPQAPTHIVLIPRTHHASLNDLGTEDDGIIGYLVRVAAKIADDEGISRQGYRLVANCGPDAGQSVDHVHFHLLGGRTLGWPPG
ncbi:MAG: histidine triad nucleotide-binding protein [Armatimonadota bacterium]